MSQFSVSEFSTLQWSFFEDVVRYAAAGFDSIGVWRGKVEDFGAWDAVDLIHEMKMSVSSLHWAGGFTGSDGRSHKEAIEDAIDAIYLAGALNANCLLLHTGARNGHIEGHSDRLIYTALERLLPIAEDLDVRLAIEPMTVGDGPNWTFLNTFEQSLNVIDKVQSPNLGLALDLYHVGCDEDILSELASHLKKLFLVQISDRSDELGEQVRCPLGTGEIDLFAWIAELTRLNYRGPFEVELQGPGMANTDYRTMLESSHEFLATTFANAATKKFIHSEIKS